MSWKCLIRICNVKGLNEWVNKRTYKVAESQYLWVGRVLRCVPTQIFGLCTVSWEEAHYLPGRPLHVTQYNVCDNESLLEASMYLTYFLLAGVPKEFNTLVDNTLLSHCHQQSCVHLIAWLSAYHNLSFSYFFFIANYGVLPPPHTISGRERPCLSPHLGQHLHTHGRGALHVCWVSG